MVVATVGAMGGAGGRAVGDRFAVAPLGAGGIVAPMSHTSMVKRTVGAQGRFLGAALGGVAEGVLVGKLGVSIDINYLFKIEAFGE